MRLDWNSSSTEVLLNPRMPGLERQHYNSLLRNCTDFPGHVWFATSGTSGKLKFAALSKNGLLISAAAVNKHLDSNEKDIWMNVLPLFHVGGIGILARGHLSCAKVYHAFPNQEKWNPSTFVSKCIEKRATLSALVPTQIHDLVKLQLKVPSSLRAIVVGGGALEYSLYESACNLGWNLLPSYGLTECSSQVATAVKGEYCSYRILEHIQLKINGEGFIMINSASLLSTFAFVEDRGLVFKDPKIDGWFRTDDRGEINASGYLKFKGRDSDFLKVGGESVSLHKVQSDFMKFKTELGITENMVLFSHRDERLGHVVALCIEGQISNPIKDLMAKYNRTVLPFERIKRVCTVAQLPKNELGKPLLRAITEAQDSSEIKMEDLFMF